jgi:4-hydroxy-tetrahydrodipicolinate synthase
MTRDELQKGLFGGGPDRLWVPLLSHYCPIPAGAKFDPVRTKAQVMAIRPYVSQFLIAGSTGDGWEMVPRQFARVIEFVQSSEAFDGECRVLFGALARTTTEVVDLVRSVEEYLPEMGEPGSRFVGIVVCPPVGESHDQRDIEDHYRAVLAQSRVPMAVYQLPQVTGCRIQPETLRRLVLDEPRIVMFKDSSGDDFVADSGLDFDGLILVRGAEGQYAESLRPLGQYDGLLVSTANVFGRQLREILDLLVGAAGDAAREKSETLSTLVREVFAMVGSLPHGNAFANSNRIVDHLMACGREWERMAPPLLHNGTTYEPDLMAEVAAKVDEVIGLPEVGYLSAQGWSL